MTSPLAVRTITTEEHLAFLRTRESARRSHGGAERPTVSFLQTPAWAKVKREWKAESLGWSLPGSPSGELVGAGLVLYRQLPKVRRYLAYLPEGPVIDWDTDDLGAWLVPMAAHLKAHGAFGIRLGPPVVTRRWSAAQVKEGIADEAVTSLTMLPPTERSQAGAKVVSQLRELGWRAQATVGGFAAGQPQYNFWVPLRDSEGKPRTEDDVLAGMNQQWRRNIKKAAKAGVVVSTGSVSTGSVSTGSVSTGSTTENTDLAAFHALYAHTAERDHFTPRPLSYFETMFEALGGEDDDRIRLYLAHHEGDLVAATIWIRVGSHTWYSYGASSSDKRDVRGSNAVQWQMIRDSIAAGAEIYDLRGITDTLTSDDPHVGLIQFKVGTGGEAIEYAGEWDLPLNRPIYKAFELYLKRRG
ncbi:MAG: peptidoglycan bridge formation glycyltransferase FemA/FemB family protein [Propionibacteriales bacterium]|nr:peptidoglycan bridge formation glycyltransferase FemA/FemB family protein [Propionibacteriales bacterium]